MAATFPDKDRGLFANHFPSWAMGYTRIVGFAVALGLSTICLGLLPNAAPVSAQTIKQSNPDAQLLLKADQLLYDNDAEMVTALGNVQLDYDGYNVVANRVSYNQKTQRVKAFGNVEILEPDGNKIYAQEIDLTDDFSQGFLNALRVETPDNTRFAAESAERLTNGDAVFNHGIYTACEPCKEKPGRAPIWQIKAQKVIIDGVTKDFTYKNARFEFFGLPIAYFPYFSHADPSIKRKSGFLFPSFGYSSDLGFSMRQPYFLVTGDTHDLTFTAHGFSKQGVLGDIRWRHRLENGSYSIRIAGIEQQNPDEFSHSPDKTEKTRGMISTKGRFDINPKWAFGWQFLGQSDNNFSRTYKIPGNSDRDITNRIYLEGLHDKSYFNLSTEQYLIQNSTIASSGRQAFQFESNQAWVRPLLDYNYVTTENLTGGELSFDFNVTSLERGELSTVNPASGDNRTYGLNGDTTRVSADLAWKKTFISSGGLMVTPSLSLRGDWTTTSGDVSSGAKGAGNFATEGSYTRFMPTAGLEVSYPVLIRTIGSSHVIEPVAQLFLRPDLNFDGVAANEDAQSLVFDASTLFQRDKFSGYDRIEGGTRANLGLRYSGQFDNGLSINALFGQSFHLAGDNPYAREDDLANTGEESGLEDNRSDYVASFAVSGNSGFGFETQARFDKDDFEVKRAEALLGYTFKNFRVATNYTYIAAQPDYSFDKDREQIGVAGSWKFADKWRVFGVAQYDTKSDLFISDSIGLSYSDECFTFSLAFHESRSRNVDTEVDRSVRFKMALRTLGEFESEFDTSDY